MLPSPPCSDRPTTPFLRPRSSFAPRTRRLAGLALGLAMLCQPSSTLLAESGSEPARALREKQAIRTHKIGIRRPAGLAYSADADRFIVLPAIDSGAPSATRATAFLMTQFGDPAGALALPLPVSNTRALAYDGHGHRLLVLEVATRSLHVIPFAASAGFDAGRATRLEAPRVGPLKPVGMTVDPASGEVFVLDHLTRRILAFTPAAAEGVPAGEEAIPAGRWIGLGPIAPLELSGLAFDPARRHLFTLDASRRIVYELADDGRHVASYDVSAIALADPQAMVFAPSGDQTDDPSTLSLFVADPGAPASRQGHVFELTAVTQEVSVTAATAVSPYLVRTTLTSKFSPPSPDPSGIAYDSVTGHLVIDDGEVDEMSIYAGKQVFETSLAGQLLRSYNVLSFTDEPVGAAFNANNRHLFISDDDHDTVFDINPGGDGLVGTSDDTRTSFNTKAFGSGDPEGIAYDRTNNRIFVADGVNEEIYVVRAGANGVFDGVSPSGDDQVTHFDTHNLGATDPETVEYKEDTGTLLVLGSTGSQVVKEVTTTGTLLSQIDLSFAPLSKPAGMAYAPTSNSPGGRSLYIVNRGVDNNSNPNENDGTLVEIGLGGGSTSNTAPVVSAGADQTITLPAGAALDGTVSDDGLPNPPGAVTSTWSVASGPGPVTFQNANAVDTQASFTTAGTYVLSLTASDGALSTTDQVQVTVQPSTGNTAPVVNAGPDQAIALPAGAALDGTVSDDGLPSPPGAVTTTWSAVSGPGPVTFQNANAVDTQASFTTAGTYVLSLTASDGALSTTDQVQITVDPAGILNRRIAAGSDDAEQFAGGHVSLNSNDLELVYDKSNQTVGLRFTTLTIPRGATILTAYVQFKADEAQSEATSLLIQGQAAGNAGTFVNASTNISSRPRTTASVSWSPSAWNLVGEVGVGQRTPDLKTAIQEIVNRSDYGTGSALVIIVTGSGHRTAESVEGNAAGAALLHVEYQ